MLTAHSYATVQAALDFVRSQTFVGTSKRLRRWKVLPSVYIFGCRSKCDIRFSLSVRSPHAHASFVCQYATPAALRLRERKVYLQLI